MFNYRKTLGLFALVCSIAGLAGCGGAAGTKSDTTPIKTCGNFQIILEDGTCGAPPPPPPCDDGYIRPSPDAACVKSEFKMPTFPTAKYLADWKVANGVAADDDQSYAIIYFNKPEADKKFGGYTIYTWQACSATWANPSADWTDEGAARQIEVPNDKDNQDPIYGAYFIQKLQPGGTCGNFIIRSAGRSQQTNDLKIQTATTGSPFDRRYFVIADLNNLRNSRVSDLPICINDICAAFKEPPLAISGTAAHWIDANTIIWDNNYPNTNVKLYRAADGQKITPGADGTVTNGVLVATLTAKDLTDAQKALVPHLSTYKAYNVDGDLSADTIKGLLKHELVAVSFKNTRAVPVDDAHPDVTVDTDFYVGTRLQTSQLLDALYTSGENDANEATLGGVYSSDKITASVWAPTAQNVELRIYGDDKHILSTKAMTEDKATGIWSYQAAKSELNNKFYRYRVTGYNQFENKTLVLEVTDPESVSLATNGYYSQFVDLDDASTKPTGWDDTTAHKVPAAVVPEAMTIYETHVRDFSASDASTPAAHRGKFLAFTDTSSVPVQHLKNLVDAGLTHIHLLPIADMSSVNEDFTAQLNLDSYVFELCGKLTPRNSAPICKDNKPNVTIRAALEKYKTGSDQTKERKATDLLSGYDGFNWGYDPEHFNVPDGSYATNSDGLTRIKEARAMNMALHNLGLRVIYDVVYPHTSAAGVKTADAIFDKIVPGYYYRQNTVSGAIENGTGAGNETASEHVMMAKFMSDSLVQWAKQYKVDGFRFDQSGFLPKSALLSAYDAVKAVDPTTYFYAEAWVANGTSGDRIAVRASQRPLAGTGIGTFNDVMRDPLRQLALVNGGALDKVRAGLAGNLTQFKLQTKSGATIKTNSIGAYNLDPREAINYVDVHDESTLWDWMHTPGALPANTTIENRVRIQDLTLSVPLLSQGVPLILAGSDILRSKSMSNNSYNAGDWFNAIDFTMKSNNWNVGLPVDHSVADADILLAFADVNSTPTPALIQKSSAVFTEFLKISKSSPLFSLTSAEDVIDRVGFHDGGKTQKDNLIVMSIDDGVGKVSGSDADRVDLDPNYDAIVVIFNGNATAISKQVVTSTGFVLHDIQKSSSDDLVKTAKFEEGTGGGTFTVPAYTTAVFVKPQNGTTQGVGLSATATTGQAEPAPYGETKIYVRGGVSATGWNTGAENELSYDGKGIYSVILNAPTTGDQQFKIAESNWSSPNLGANATITLGQTLTLTQGSGDNVHFNVPAVGPYKFQLDASQSITAPTVSITVPTYIRGTVSATGWGANSNNEMRYEGNGISALVLDMVPGPYQFKVASDDWSTVNMGTSSPVVLGDALPIVQGSSSNVPLTITTAGTYRFELNNSNPSAPTIKVFVDDLYKDTPIYLRGTVSSAGWNATDVNKFIYTGGKYQLTLNNIVAGSYQFKVAETNWANPNFGGATVTVNGGPAVLVQGGDNIPLTIATTGNYLFKVDASKPAAVTVSVESK